MKRRVYNIKATGRRFKIGDSFRPTWSELRAVLLNLDSRPNVGQQLFPYLHEHVSTATKEDVHNAVPDILFNAGQYYNRYSDGVKACLWVVAWYYHIWLNGPRPKTRRKVRRLRSLPTATFKCPMCGEHYFVPRKIRTQSAAIGLFAVWLTRHCKESYHHNKPTGRLPYRYETNGRDKRTDPLSRTELPAPHTTPQERKLLKHQLAPGGNE